MQAMGGKKAWDDTRYIRFAFRVGSAGEWRVDRRHLWDKWDGRYRFENTTEDGKRLVVLFNVNTKQGNAFVDGNKSRDEETAKALDAAYSAFINDTYWLAMPWKWLDPGVNLRYVGEDERRGQACDVVELSFEGVGLTPGDRYRAFVSKASNLMIHWEYTLQSDRKGAWDWEYLETGGIKLARTHTNDEGTEIDMGNVRATSTVDEALFSDASKPLQ